MINFAKLFKRNGSSKFRPKVPEGQRFYVIGDIHGRCDLLDELILAIEEDDAQVGQAETTIIFLGDLVDRGPESARVIDGEDRTPGNQAVLDLVLSHGTCFMLPGGEFLSRDAQGFDQAKVIRGVDLELRDGPEGRRATADETIRVLK